MAICVDFSPGEWSTDDLASAMLEPERVMLPMHGLLRQSTIVSDPADADSAHFVAV
jgi:hypothetical protein